MKVNLEFNSIEEMNLFCSRQAISSGLLEKKKINITYPDIEFLKYVYSKKIGLTEIQWGFVRSFFEHSGLYISGLERQCGKSFFLQLLCGYFIEKTDIKILVLQHNYLCEGIFVNKLKGYLDLYVDRYRERFRCTSPSKIDSLRGLSFDLILFDEISEDVEHKVKTMFPSTSKIFSLKSGV